jgi:hypothetical protein
MCSDVNVWLKGFAGYGDDWMMINEEDKVTTAHALPISDTAAHSDYGRLNADP